TAYYWYFYSVIIGTWGNNAVTRMSKTLLVLLTISIAANFAAFGFIGVRAAKDYVYHSVLEDSEIVQSVPKEFRNQFQEALNSNRWELLKRLRALRIARDEQHMILTAEVFDDVALVASQERVRTATDQLIILLQMAIVDAAKNSPPDARRGVPKPNYGGQLLQYLDALEGPSESN
ncbi:MAG: hypothetical protein AAGA76_04285, partial [Pseudomonadota bacterium]